MRKIALFTIRLMATVLLCVALTGCGAGNWKHTQELMTRAAEQGDRDTVCAIAEEYLTAKGKKAEAWQNVSAFFDDTMQDRAAAGEYLRRGCVAVPGSDALYDAYFTRAAELGALQFLQDNFPAESDLTFRGRPIRDYDPKELWYILKQGDPKYLEGDTDAYEYDLSAMLSDYLSTALPGIGDGSGLDLGGLFGGGGGDGTAAGSGNSGDPGNPGGTGGYGGAGFDPSAIFGVFDPNAIFGENFDPSAIFGEDFDPNAILGDDFDWGAIFGEEGEAFGRWFGFGSGSGSGSNRPDDPGDPDAPSDSGRPGGEGSSDASDDPGRPDDPSADTGLGEPDGAGPDGDPESPDGVSGSTDVPDDPAPDGHDDHDDPDSHDDHPEDPDDHDGHNGPTDDDHTEGSDDHDSHAGDDHPAGSEYHDGPTNGDHHEETHFDSSFLLGDPESWWLRRDYRNQSVWISYERGAWVTVRFEDLGRYDLNVSGEEEAPALPYGLSAAAGFDEVLRAMGFSEGQIEVLRPCRSAWFSRKGREQEFAFIFPDEKDEDKSQTLRVECIVQDRQAAIEFVFLEGKLSGYGVTVYY